MPQPFVDSGSVSPDSLHGMMMVLRFIWYVTGYGQTEGIPNCASAWSDSASTKPAGRPQLTSVIMPWVWAAAQQRAAWAWGCYNSPPKDSER